MKRYPNRASVAIGSVVGLIRNWAIISVARQHGGTLRDDTSVPRARSWRLIAVAVAAMLAALLLQAPARADSPSVCGPLAAAWDKAQSDKDGNTIAVVKANIDKLQALCPDLHRRAAQGQPRPERPVASNRTPSPAPKPAPLFDMARLDPADRARAVAAGCIPGARVAPIHATHVFMGEGYHHYNGVDNSRPLVDLGTPFIVDRTHPVDGNQCNVWLADNDPTHPWPKGAIPLDDIKAFDEAKATIASMRFNQPKQVLLRNFADEFHQDMINRAGILGIDASTFREQEIEVRRLVQLCSEISQEDEHDWLVSRMGREHFLDDTPAVSPGHHSKEEAIALTKKYLPCLVTSGYGHKILGPRVLFARFYIRGEKNSEPYGVKVQFDLDRGADGKPADTAAMKGVRSTTVYEIQLSWFEVFGIANYQFVR